MNSTKAPRLAALSVVSAMLLSLSANAATIVKPTGVALNITTTQNIGTPTRMIDGSGLSSALNTGDAVPGTYPTHQVGGKQPGTFPMGNIEMRLDRTIPNPDVLISDLVLTFDLGGGYDLDGMALWNYTENWNGTWANTRGVRNFDLTFSTDGMNFGAPTSLVAATVAPSVNPFEPQTFSFSASGVTHVRMQNMSNHDNSIFMGHE